MALVHLGTNANNSIASAITYIPSISAADIASLAQAITDDKGNRHYVVQGAFSIGGPLVIPNRGFLYPQNGDVIAIDATGWPILVSARAIASGPWTVS